jgi:predicted nucleotidyltransferase
MITGSGNGASQNPAYRPSPAFFFLGSRKIVEVCRVHGNTTIAQDKLDLIIQRIVEVAKPEKIILFGSAVRGAMGPNSDVDLLVIKSGANRLDLMGEIYRNLHGVGEPVDVIVATPEDVERYRNSHSLVFAPALKEGRVVYAA